MARRFRAAARRQQQTKTLDTIIPACGLSHRVDLKTGRVTMTSDSR